MTNDISPPAGGNGGSSAASSGGGAGGASGYTGGDGGNGGAAAGGVAANTAGTGSNSRTSTAGGSFTGGNGGNGLAGPNVGDGGGGGGGGNSGYSSFVNPAFFADLNVFANDIGGKGGDGGAGNTTGGGGGGGAGGYGVITNKAGGAITVTGSALGGTGGAGGAAGGPAAFGGGGGVGIFLSSGNQTVSISGTGRIAGGDGGLGGGAPNGGTAGSAGQGGIGLVGSNLRVTNAGSISGGLNGGSTTDRAFAIDFTGGTNTLTPGTGTLNGGLRIAGTLNVLGAAPNNLGPVTNAGTFDISGTTGTPVTTLSGAGGTTLGAQTLTITNGSTSYGGAITGTGGVAVTGGTQALTGASTYSGGTTIGANGSAVSSTLQLGGAASAGTGAITFGNMSGTATAQLGLNVAAQPANGGTFGNTLTNFNTSSQLNLVGLTNSSVSYNSANSSITVTGTRTGGGNISETFLLSAPRATNFVATADGNGGTRITATNPAAAPCYVTGTRIRILRGLTIQDVPVERLRVGDLAITASGRPRPIRWIGTRSYPGLTAPRHDRPVRIRAGALAEGVPARDLLVSPDHCLSFDGLFVAAGHLSNGTSIVRGEAVRDLTYWHIELDSHDLLMAENTPAESFLAAPGVRVGFDGTAIPDAAVAPVAYAPRAERYTPEMVALSYEWIWVTRAIRRRGDLGAR